MITDGISLDYLLLILFSVATLAGFIDSIAGGGGLLTLPTLLAVGLSPAQALATNKLQSCGGSFSASIYFVQKGMVKLSDNKLSILMTFIGASVGSLLILYLNAEVLRLLLPILTIGVGLYFLLTPTLGDTDRERRLTVIPFAIFGAMVIGFYDGFFGPGAGSFYALIYVVLAGFNLAKATAHAKVLNFTSNLASLLFFIGGGKVIWSIGLVMLLGQFIGARIGATLVIAKGKKLIRPMLIIVSLAMSVKLLIEIYV